ncbi:hypothetical protein BJ741DRAFT_276179 [Chytriomyces cf. hyalinus JEL632]|nr:hypothetical protein BJ741DRAFT_276179 [Chytriomyces cf. hyalinus JEL632]
MDTPTTATIAAIVAATTATAYYKLRQLGHSHLKPTASKFNPSSNIPDLTVKTVLVTEGSYGSGLEVCRMLGKRGARVFMGCGVKQRGVDAVIRLKQELPNADIHVLVLRATDPIQIRGTALMLAERIGSVDVVVFSDASVSPNETGYSNAQFAAFESVLGLDRDAVLQHMARFVLTLHLLPVLQKASNPRICVASNQANDHSIIFAKELNARYGETIHVNAFNAGLCLQDLSAHSLHMRATAAIFSVLPKSVRNHFNIISPEEAATAPLYAATSSEIVENKVKGQLIVPLGLVSNEPVDSSVASRDAGANLWELSEQVYSEFEKSFPIS